MPVPLSVSMETPGHVCIHASTPVTSVRICTYVYVSILRLYLRQYLHRISICVHIRISAYVSLSLSVDRFPAPTPLRAPVPTSTPMPTPVSISTNAAALQTSCL